MIVIRGDAHALKNRQCHCLVFFFIPFQKPLITQLKYQSWRMFSRSEKQKGLFVM